MVKRSPAAALNVATLIAFLGFCASTAAYLLQQASKEDAAPNAETTAAVAPIPDVAVVDPVMQPDTEVSLETAGTVVVVPEPAETQEDGTLVTRAQIRSIGEQEVTGALWGVATYRGTHGEILRIPSHKGVDPLAPHSRRPSDAVTFKVRRVVQKALTFKAPVSSGYTLESVLIYVSRGEGEMPLIASLPGPAREKQSAQ